MTAKIGNLAFLLMAGIFGVVYFLDVQMLPLPEERLIIEILFPALLVLLVLETSRTIYKIVKDKKQENEESLRNSWDMKLFVFITSFTAYVLLFPILGFFVTSFVFLAGLNVFLGSRNVWEYLPVPLGILGVIYFVFVHLLHVRFPEGLLF